MNKPARYPGWDPAEDDFEGVEMAPLHDHDARPVQTVLNLPRVWQLKASGKSWREIGQILAREDGRRMPYQGVSVYNAARRCRMADMDAATKSG